MSRIGARRAETADGAIHQSGVELQQFLDTGVESCSGTGAAVLNIDIRFADQAAEELTVIRTLHIEHDAALVAVVSLEMRRVLSALIRPVGIAFRALDLDHVCAKIGEHHSRTRTGDEGALLDDAN